MPSPYAIEKVVSEAQQLLAALKADEPELDQDRLEMVLASETNVHEMLVVVARLAAEADAFGNAVDARMKVLAERKARYTARRKAARECIMQIMDAVSLTKVDVGEYTISTRGGVLQAAITDATKLPAEFMRQADPVPDKTEILRQLKAGVLIPGAAMIVGEKTLTMRSN
jgi:hypothetical protein